VGEARGHAWPKIRNNPMNEKQCVIFNFIFFISGEPKMDAGDEFFFTK